MPNVLVNPNEWKKGKLYSSLIVQYSSPICVRFEYNTYTFFGVFVLHNKEFTMEKLFKSWGGTTPRSCRCPSSVDLSQAIRLSHCRESTATGFEFLPC